MRNLLATAVAIAPLLAATGAQAEIVISTARTTPIQTSNATGTAADNVRIASGGSIAVTTGAAVTLNSNNTVDVDSGGSITMANAADGVSAILVNAGQTGGVIMGGAISITDSITEYEDADEDGDLDGSYAAGTNRAGIRVAGTGVFDGDILVERSGAISVEGNNSYGVTIDSGLDGSLTNVGAIRVLGDNTVGIRVAGDVTGDVNLLGTITATGANATGASIQGDVGGGLKVHGAITTTGYRYTTPPNAKPTTGTVTESILYLEDLDADDLLQGGPALSVAGNIAGGVLLDRGPAYASGGLEGDDDGDDIVNGDEDDDGDGTKNREDTDRDGDGLTDTDETTAALTSLGGAPALQVGSATSAVTLGLIGTGDSAYGLINRGSISASGVYKGVDGTAVQLGVAGGQAVTIQGGVRNEGTISATGFDANATGVSIGAGVTTPTLVNTGTLQAGLRSDEDFTSTAVQIDAGASLPSMTNTGVISSNIQGNHAAAVAIRDESGTLTSLTNSGRISTSRTANATDETAVDGALVAIDLSANATGATIVQFGVEDADDDDIDTDGDGVTDAKEPFIVGDILLGTGSDVVDIRNGNVVGDIAFGTGSDSLLISGGATVAGAITDADGLLDIDLSDGTLIAGQTEATTISNLDVGADGTLIFNLDPEADVTTGFDVTGTANLAEGAAVGVRFDSLLQGEERFTVISAGDLNAGTIDQSLVESNSPYVYVVEAGVDAAANELYINARRRTADEAGMIASEAAAYDAVYDALGDSETLQNLFLTQTDRDGFFDAYQQMLPDHSGGTLMSLASGVDAVTRALTGRNASAAPGETSAWVQEINFYAEKDKTQSYGFESEGFGIAGGVERGTRLGAVGLSVAFTSSDLEDPEAKAEEVLSASLLELGLYWRAQGQYWTTWARAAAGYASFSADRSLVADGVYLNNTSDWHGWTAAAAGGASYERNFGKFNVRPEIYAEYFHLSEDARTESGGGDGFDLDIDSREGHMFSAVAAMNIGYGFGRDGWLRPELRVGWRQNISVDAGETIARFASGGSDFILDPDSIEGGGPILGFRVNVGNELGLLSITGDAELLEDYVRYSLLLRASFRF